MVKRVLRSKQGHWGSETAVNSLFANLLDNACEAAARMPEGKGWIHVKIRKANDMVFISLANSMAKEPKRRGERLISDKPADGLHGLGISSAARAAEKYGGELGYQYGNGIFTVEVYFLNGILAKE